MGAITRRDLLKNSCLIGSAVVVNPALGHPRLDDQAESHVEKLHRKQLHLFERQVDELRPLLREHEIEEVRFGGTLATQSGDAVGMLAPLQPPAGQSLEQVVSEGTLFAALWLSSEAIPTRFGETLPPGVYALRFLPPQEGEVNTDVQFLTSEGMVAHTAHARFVLPGGHDSLLDEIRAALARLGFELPDNGTMRDVVAAASSSFGIVNFAIVTNLDVPDSPTTAIGSFLFWDFELWSDP